MSEPDLVEIVLRIKPYMTKDDHNDPVHYFNEFALRYAGKPYKNNGPHHRTLLYERFIRKKYKMGGTI